ncbi:MAG: hypothetical protein ABH860_00660 [bacterium]
MAEVGNIQGATKVLVPVAVKPPGTNEVKANNAFSELRAKMKGLGFTDPQIDKIFADLEGYVGRVMGKFGQANSPLCLDKYTVRKWLADVVSKQISKQMKKDPKFLEGLKNDPNILSKIKPGKEGIYDLLNAYREDLGFFEKRLSSFVEHKVTPEAVRELLGGEEFTLADFMNEMDTRVFVFAGTVSPGMPLVKVLQLFAAAKIIVMPEGLMAGRVQKELYRTAEMNIKIKYPQDSEKAEDKDDRENLLNKARSLIYGENGEKPEIKGLLNYFKITDKDFEKSPLYAYIYHAYESEAASLPEGETVVDVRKVLDNAGLAMVCGGEGLISHLEDIGVNPKVVYDLIETKEDGFIIRHLKDLKLIKKESKEETEKIKQTIEALRKIIALIAVRGAEQWEGSPLELSAEGQSLKDFLNGLGKKTLYELTEYSKNINIELPKPAATGKILTPVEKPETLPHT